MSNLQYLEEHIKERPNATFTFFVPDKTKEGGIYKTVSCHIKRIDEYDELVYLDDGTRVMFEDIISVDIT